MPDRFPEAFARFESKVDVDSFENYRELAYAFSHWAGKRWIDSYKQNWALKREGNRLGFRDAKIPEYLTRGIGGWRRSAVSGRHRGLKDRQVSIINASIRKGYSANKIQRQLRNQGLGIRRKELLRNIREMKMKSIKANPEKHIPKKYRNE
jgi:hypothetical protein